MTSARILVVDDNDANRALARSTLEDEGYTVISAPTGAAAIDAFRLEPVDCVLMDVRMPDLDGFAACERIRALPHGQETPVLFLTALRDVDTFDHALRAGADDFLTKPIRPTELVLRVQAALKLRGLRQELREHFDLLKRQRDDLLRLQLQKERLMAFVVHDLKNPVNAMDLHAQVLLRERDASSTVRESAAQIRTQARHLSRMILNLLDVAKADEGQLAPKRSPVALDTLVTEILDELALDAAKHDVTLRGALETSSVSADEDILRRTLTNLVENAIRYAPASSTVLVSAVQHGAEIELRIADAGKGIPPEMREKVFDAFVQLDSDREGSKRMGRGLGLAFCKLAVEAHGGRIWIEGASPGAVFCLRLPHVP